MGRRYFTLEEARRLLPFLREMTEKAMRISQRLEQYREEVQALAEQGPSNSGSAAGTAYLEELIAIQTCLVKIQETGCLVKSIQEGLIDFPHWRAGREVYLCWKYGEDDIRFWHEVDAGFAGRTPLLD